MKLKPLVGILMAKGAQEALHESVAARINVFQIAYLGKGIGQVAPTAARDFNLGQNPIGALKDGDICLGTRLLEVDGEEKACGSSANDCDFHKSGGLGE